MTFAYAIKTDYTVILRHSAVANSGVEILHEACSSSNLSLLFARRNHFTHFYDAVNVKYINVLSFNKFLCTPCHAAQAY